MKLMKNNSIGGSFDDFLVEERLLEAVEVGTVKKIIAYQLQKTIEKENLDNGYSHA
jgi:hypothetical protein